MDLILMSILTLVGVGAGTAVGYYWGFDAAMISGSEVAYEDGYRAGLEENKSIDDFPRSLDGKFFSTDAAIRYMNGKEVKKEVE